MDPKIRKQLIKILEEKNYNFVIIKSKLTKLNQ